MAESTRLEDGVWAVVNSGIKRYIARFENAEALERVSPTSLETYEIEVMNIPVQDRTTGQMGIQREVKVVPIDTCTSGVPVTFADVQNFFLLSALEKHDREDYERMVTSIREQAAIMRAKKLGITIPGQA